MTLDRSAAALALALVSAIACRDRAPSQRQRDPAQTPGTDAAPATTPAAIDLLATLVQTFPAALSAAPIADPVRRRSLAIEVVRMAAVHDDAFAEVGSAYHGFPFPEPDPTCLAAGTCLRLYGDFQRTENLRAHGGPPPAPDDPRVAWVEQVLARGQVRADLARQGEQAVAAIRATPVRRWRGPASAPTAVWLVHDGHPAEAWRDAAIERFLRAFPERARFADVYVADAPALRARVGARMAAAMVIGDRLLLDVFDDAQLAELLVGRAAGDAVPAPSPPTHIVDAHLHLAPGGAARLLTLLEHNAIERAVVAPLAQNPRYDGLDEANLELLAMAREHRDRITPLAMLSPLHPDPLADLRRYLALGARGVKLMSGHDDFWVASGRGPLDSEPMRKVFAYCQEHRLPVLWHVNGHLGGEGLLRVLDDFPGLVVVLPHLGGYLTYLPHVIRTWLARYPNLHVDLSWGGQSMYLRRSFEDLSAQHEAWRQLVLDFPDRFLFGTDLVITDDTSGAHAATSYRLYRSMIADPTYDLAYYGPAGHDSLGDLGHYHLGMHGLALPADVLAKVLADNAARVYGPAR